MNNDNAEACFRYEWRRNGAPIGSVFNIMRPARGAIRIRPLTSLDEGHYECRAFNQYGTAVSRSTLLQRAHLSRNPSVDVREERGLVEGRPHMIPCVPVNCSPEPSFTWMLAENEYQSSMPVLTDSRIQIDEQGLLAFCLSACCINWIQSPIPLCFHQVTITTAWIDYHHIRFTARFPGEPGFTGSPRFLGDRL